MTQKQMLYVAIVVLAIIVIWALFFREEEESQATLVAADGEGNETEAIVVGIGSGLTGIAGSIARAVS